MIVNAENLAALQRSFRVIFNDALKAAPNRMTLIATEVPSTGASQDFPIGGLLATIREWIGDRQIQNIAAWTQTIRNRDFEGTVGIPRKAVDDDQVGVYKPSIQQLSVDAGNFPYDVSLDALMVKSRTVNGFDGVPFFSATHKWKADGAAQSNTATATLSTSALATGLDAMLAYKRPNGDPMGIVPDTFVCGSALRATVEALFFKPTLAGGESNIDYGRFAKDKVLIEPRISGNAWAMFYCGGPIKPVIFQSRKKPVFVALDRETDANVFMKGDFVYGVDFRCAAAAIPWWLGYGSTGAGG